MRESEKHVNYASKARDSHVGGKRQKTYFFKMLVVVSCDRIIRKHLTCVPHDVIRFLEFNWILFRVLFFNSVEMKKQLK